MSQTYEPQSFKIWVRLENDTTGEILIDDLDYFSVEDLEMHLGRYQDAIDAVNDKNWDYAQDNMGELDEKDKTTED